MGVRGPAAASNSETLSSNRRLVPRKICTSAQNLESLSAPGGKKSTPSFGKGGKRKGIKRGRKTTDTQEKGKQQHNER